MNELLSDQLKIRTAAPHQELERALIQRMRAMQTTEDYIALLQVFYRFFRALEDRISVYIGSAELPDHLQRRKSESLAIDIRALSGVLPEKVTLSAIPVIDDQLQAFGALYVMEGSTLGGQIICQMITKYLGIQDKGLSFFQSYGEHRTTMWTTFKLTLNRQADNDADRERVIAAAGATFHKFKKVLDANIDIGSVSWCDKQMSWLSTKEDLVLNVASQAAIALDKSKLLEELLDFNRKKDEFIAMASHELKTPLTWIHLTNVVTKSSESEIVVGLTDYGKVIN